MFRHGQAVCLVFPEPLSVAFFLPSLLATLLRPAGLSTFFTIRVPLGAVLSSAGRSFARAARASTGRTGGAVLLKLRNRSLGLPESLVGKFQLTGERIIDVL